MKIVFLGLGNNGKKREDEVFGVEARLAVSLQCSGCLRCWVSPAGGILRGQGGACAPISGNHVCSLFSALRFFHFIRRKMRGSQGWWWRTSRDRQPETEPSRTHTLWDMQMALWVLILDEQWTPSGLSTWLCEAPHLGNELGQHRRKVCSKMIRGNAERLRQQDLGSQTVLLSNPIFLFTICVTLGKWPNISEPLFPYLLKESIIHRREYLWGGS